MDFPYVKVTDFPGHQKRQRLLPWVRIGIYNPEFPDKVIYPLGLIDSGADITIVDREFGEELGYEIEKGSKEEIKGVGGGVLNGFLHKLGFVIENPDKPEDIIKYIDLVLFVKTRFPLSMPQQTAIFGTLGFFRHLIVTFVFPRQIIVERLIS